MPILIIYLPRNRVAFDKNLPGWGMPKYVMHLLNSHFSESDSIIELSAYHNGDSFENIIQRCDIYGKMTA